MLLFVACAGSEAAVTTAAAPVTAAPDTSTTAAPPATTAAPTAASAVGLTQTAAAAPAAPAAPAADAPAASAAAAPPAPAAPAPAPAEPAPPPAAPVQKGPKLELAAPLAAPLVPVSGRSARGSVSALQQRLLDLGFWVPDTNGSYNWETSQAVMAFQKYNGLSPSGTADDETIALMNIAPYRVLAQAWDKDMIEVDKGKQVLFVVQGGRTIWAFNTSTGSGSRYVEPSQREPGEMVSGTAETPEGVFNVYSEQSNGWWKGELGELYRPKFFKGGAAIHGAPKVPNFPASHGCVRVTPEAMDFIWAQNYMPRGGPVWVHA
jgi:peptidoglycan hydrolase-like protein with peptidoglycan-binding domain